MNLYLTRKMNRQGSSSTCGGYYDSKSIEIRVTRRVKGAIHIRIHSNKINRDSRIEIPDALMPTIKKHNNRRALRQRTAEGANHWVKQHGSKCTNQSCWKTTNHSRASCFIRSRMTSRPHRLKKTMQSKRRDPHHTRLHRETNEENLALIVKSCFLLLWSPIKAWVVCTSTGFPFFKFSLIVFKWTNLVSSTELIM